MHIYNFGSQSWTTQHISAAGTDPNTLDAILDRDTNVFYALSHSQLYSLDMGTLTQADGTTRSWVYVQDPPFAQNYTNPVMALANNHIQFLNTGTGAEVNIFVIHFSFSQPTPQVFAPLEVGGQGYPSTTGQTATIFKTDQAPQKFVFIPDSGGNTYIFDTIVSIGCVEMLKYVLIGIFKANTTQAMPPPIDKATSRLAASEREIVQMTTSGDVYWIPFNPDDVGPNYGATWTKIALSLNATPPTDFASVNSTSSSPSTRVSTGTSTVSTISPASTSGALARGKLGLLPTALMTLGLGACGLWSIS
jgi:hypothetical protein